MAETVRKQMIMEKRDNQAITTDYIRLITFLKQHDYQFVEVQDGILVGIPQVDIKEKPLVEAPKAPKIIT